ncbi:MAG TPA: Na/Pi cotransporter family protein [Clostridia bacterium]|jgi:phosphate:Na+ symporter|nr:Na/Pi cotransporter family protein [Clostridiaceae bacterium]HOF26995.1 Na/Pi cotransporter family protein [Clostridia bacterium]HOM34982.1 Na/Pi cotransporter family protein [Clostridia bacterium]HOT70730.1 Na/Pi cotransporter family protein [Clostridia bacterium]HQG00762.1 Na/Pi cotransporter family protein [Clostridia bacterium]
MSFFSILTIFAGLTLFLYGMNLMGIGLERVAGRKLESVIEKATSRPIKGVLIGAAVTAVIQSSSATTVMLVGFVNSGLMRLSQVVGVIMGANIGTTITAWILSLVSVDSSNFIVRIFKPDTFAPILGIIGIGLVMAGKRNKNKDVGRILLGFFILMFGMTTMSDAVKPLAQMEGFTKMLTMFSNPILGILTGAIFTAIIQSSSASVGVLQALSTTGVVTFGSAVPIILGQNIGTCATALISSIGTNKNAKRAALIHLFFNVIGTVLFASLFYGLNAVFDFAFVNSVLNPVGIAIFHTIFNVLTTLVLFPFTKLLVRLSETIIKDKGTVVEKIVLDERFLNTPSIAVEQCKRYIVTMANVTKETILMAIPLVKHYDAKKAQVIVDNEDLIDTYEDKLGSYLVKLSGRELNDKDSKEISKILHSISDFERISDHAVNILDVAKELYDKDITFSEQAYKELDVMASAVEEILDLTVDAFLNNDFEKASKVEPLEQVIDELKIILKNRHIERLQGGGCTIELGFILSDLINNYERVSDHCSNLAVLTIQIAEGLFDTHEYLQNVKQSDRTHYMKYYRKYHDKYDVARIVDNNIKNEDPVALPKQKP